MMRTRTGLFVAIVMAVMLIAGAAIAAGGTQATITDTRPVQLFSDGTNTGGYSNLTRTSEELLLSVEAQGLTPGDAYTVWWVVFNNPEGCSPEGAPICGEDDIFNEDGNLNVDGVVAAQIAVGNATGNVAKANGTAEFGARLKKNDTTSDHQILFPAGLEGGALLTAMPSDAEVHLIFQSHGQARGGPQLLKQLTYVETGCTPFCEDVQFTVFPALP